jgi:hypothetical protein
LNKALVMELARSEYIERRENIIAIGNSGTGKSHIALGLGLAKVDVGLGARLEAATKRDEEARANGKDRAPGHPPPRLTTPSS